MGHPPQQPANPGTTAQERHLVLTGRSSLGSNRRRPGSNPRISLQRGNAPQATHQGRRVDRERGQRSCSSSRPARRYRDHSSQHYTGSSISGNDAAPNATSRVRSQPRISRIRPTSSLRASSSTRIRSSGLRPSRVWRPRVWYAGAWVRDASATRSTRTRCQGSLQVLPEHDGPER